MPTPRVPMSKQRQILQLLHDGHLSTREIAAALHISKTSVGDIAKAARLAGLDWEAASKLSDDELSVRIYKPGTVRRSQLIEPDYSLLYRELKRADVTLQLLWEEYQGQHGTNAYKYSAFCDRFRQWSKTLKLSMRQIHPGGERAFLDFAGHTVPIIDSQTGEITQAQIFVAVLGASSYTYACATQAQKVENWVLCTIAALEHFGGVPRLLVPDQPRTVSTRPDRYEPTAQRLFAEMCAYYSVALLPARPAKPRDKPKVEAAVLLVERWVLARLRKQTFFSIAELNAAIAPLVLDLNNRPFKKLEGCRRSAYEELDKPVLRPLPVQRMQIYTFKSPRVNVDYHIEYEHRFYSVPYQLVGQQVELRATSCTVEIMHNNVRVAMHAAHPRKGSFTTLAEHMPENHREHLQWSPDKLIAWAQRVGKACEMVVRWQLEHRAHPEQAYRSCLGLMRLLRTYGRDRLEAACARAQSIRAPNYKSIDSILKSGMDYLPVAQQAVQVELPLHENVRGANYYH
ncbi:MAG: IS21 family transposase [Burkholderiales bacterium]